jgi:hypothetical protein
MQTMAKDENGIRYELAPAFGNGPFQFEVPAFRWWEGIVEVAVAEPPEGATPTGARTL